MPKGKSGGSLPDPTVEPRVIEAVLEELATRGRDHLSMDRIAGRAGVSKVTIYTRWRSKDELLVAAYQSLSRPFPTLDTGTLAGDLNALCQVVLAGAADPRYIAVLTELVASAATDPTLRPHLHTVSTNWRTGLAMMLHAARDRGELAADVDVDLLAETLSAFTLRRVMFADPPLDDTLCAALAALVHHPPRS